MADSYALIPQCRICSKVSDETRKSIDKDILLGLTPKDIVAKYASKFPEASPLTIYSVQNHRKHYLEFLAVKKLEHMEVSDGKLAIVPKDIEESLKVQKFISETSLKVAEGIINEEAILQTLMLDSFNDITSLNEQIMAGSLTGKYLRATLATKDTIKKNLIEAIQKNKELRQKVGGEMEQLALIKDILNRMLKNCVLSLKEVGVSKSVGELFGKELERRLRLDPLISKYMEG